MATINVPADQATIAAAITAASAGDIVLIAAAGGPYTLSGVVLNKAITLKSTDGAIITSSSDGNGTGIRIASNNCVVDGLRVEDYSMGIGVSPSDLTGYTNVQLRNNHTHRCQYHLWMTGTNWVVEDNQFEKCRRWSPTDDSDYGRGFGSGHIYRRNHCFGTVIPTDLAPGPDYAHCDCLQTYTQNGEVFQNIQIYQNFFEAYIQGLFLGEEFENPLAIANVEVYNNVFVGGTYTPTGNILDSPSHGIFFGKDQVALNISIHHNILINHANAISIDYQGGGNDALVEYNIIYDYGTLYNTNGPHIDFGDGNIVFGGGWPGAFGTNAVDVYEDPDLIGTDYIGPDDTPFTADDEWPSVAYPLYGPQVELGAPDPDIIPPVITLTGNATMNWNQSQGAWVDPGYSAVDETDGDLTAAVVVAGDAVNVNVPGLYTITYNVSDAALNAATQKTRAVTVVDNVIPVITRVGAATINLAVDDPYVDDGATAADNTDGDITAEIVTVGDVIDTSVPGIYTVTYNVVDAAANAAVEVTRTVNVNDEEGPVITLTGPASLAISINDTYIELGATAVDDVDGAVAVVITGTVSNGIPGVYTKFYNAEDAQENAATQVTRIVTIVDDRIPVITLLGPSTVQIAVGGTYTEPGYLALDETDGDLTGDVVVGGDTVNELVAGDYIITYNVSDEAGNTATEKTRLVQIETPPASLPTLGRNTPTGGGLLWGIIFGSV